MVGFHLTSELIDEGCHARGLEYQMIDRPTGRISLSCHHFPLASVGTFDDTSKPSS